MTETKKEGMGNLVNKLSKIQRELKAPKNQYNSFGKYNYRNCEDIMEAVKPFLDGLVLMVTDDIVSIGERYYVKATAILIDEDEKSLSNSAYAREADTKAGMDVAQITGAASSYARKYALNGLFAIDDTKDADSNDNTPQKPAPKAPTKPAPMPTVPAKKTENTPDWAKNVMNGTQNATAGTPTTSPNDIFDAKLPEEPMQKDAYRDDKGEISRDTKGHTACVNCGKMVGKPSEEYSLKNFGKVLCMPCQAKERGKGK